MVEVVSPSLSPIFLDFARNSTVSFFCVGFVTFSILFDLVGGFGPGLCGLLIFCFLCFRKKR